MVEIEKDEEECQWIAYTLSSLSPKRENIQMKKILFKRAFPDRLALNQSLPKSKKKSKTKKSLTWTMKFEFRDKRDECCWVNLFSMLFS